MLVAVRTRASLTSLQEAEEGARSALRRLRDGTRRKPSCAWSCAPFLTVSLGPDPCQGVKGCCHMKLSDSFRLGYWQVVFQIAAFEGPPRHPCEPVHSINWQPRSGTGEGEQGWREFWESFSKRRRSGKGWDLQGIECEGKWKEGRGRILANPHLRGGRWSCIGGPTGVVSRARREWAPGSHQKSFGKRGGRSEEEFPEGAGGGAQMGGHWIGDYWSVAALLPSCAYNQKVHWTQDPDFRWLKKREKREKLRQLLFFQDFNLWKKGDKEYVLIPWRSQQCFRRFSWERLTCMRAEGMNPMAREGLKCKKEVVRIW